MTYKKTKALTPNKFKHHKLKYFSLARHLYPNFWSFLLEMSFWICLKTSPNRRSVVSGRAFEKYVFILRWSHKLLCGAKILSKLQCEAVSDSISACTHARLSLKWQWDKQLRILPIVSTCVILKKRKNKNQREVCILRLCNFFFFFWNLAGFFRVERFGGTVKRSINDWKRERIDTKEVITRRISARILNEIL